MKSRLLCTEIAICCIQAFQIPQLATAQQYTHRRIGTYRGVGFGYITDDGVPIYLVTEGDPNDLGAPYDVYVDGVNYTGSVFNGDHYCYGPKLLRNGDIYWTGGQTRIDVYKNNVNITQTLYGNAYNVSEYRVNERGNVAVHLSLDHSSTQDTFLDGFNMSKAALGNGLRQTQLLHLTDDGTLFWRGTGPKDQGNDDVFRNLQNTDADALGANRAAYQYYVNSNGQYLWTGLGDKTGGWKHVFLGQADVTRALFGSTDHNDWAVALSDTGSVLMETFDAESRTLGMYKDGDRISDVLGVAGGIDIIGYFASDGRAVWSGGGTAFGKFTDVFADRANLSAALLGGNRQTRLDGVIPNGNVLWHGYGNLNPHFDLFVEQFNLSASAIGDASQSYWALGASGNKKGQIIWGVARNGMEELWVSTPVPEPGAIAAAGFAILGLILRRRQRAK
jgi:hypothetical protein